MTPEQEALVVNHLYLARRVVLSKRRHLPDTDDLIAQGYLGLMAAAERFDPSRGMTFSTYAVYWIRAYVWQWQVEFWQPIRVPSTSGKEASTCLRHGKAPRQQRVRDAMKVFQMKRCHYPLGDAPDQINLIDESTPLEHGEIREWCEHAIDSLDAESRSLVRRVLGIGRPPETQIAI